MGPSPRGLGPPITPQSSNYSITNLELLVVFLDEPVLVHTRTFELWAKKDVSQDVLGQAEDPEVVPPAQEEGDQSCSSRGSLDIQTGRSWLPIQWRIQKLFLQLQKKKIQLKKKETKVAPPEDPEVVPPAQEGDQSCST